MLPDPDVVRIRESYQAKCECIWIRFRNSGSDWARTSLVCKGTRHLDHPWEAGNAMPCSRTMPSKSGKSQTRKYHVHHYHLTVNLLP